MAMVSCQISSSCVTVLSRQGKSSCTVGVAYHKPFLNTLHFVLSARIMLRLSASVYLKDCCKWMCCRVLQAFLEGGEIIWLGREASPCRPINDILCNITNIPQPFAQLAGSALFLSKLFVCDIVWVDHCYLSSAMTVVLYMTTLSKMQHKSQSGVSIGVHVRSLFIINAHMCSRQMILPPETKAKQRPDELWNSNWKEYNIMTTVTLWHLEWLQLRHKSKDDWAALRGTSRQLRFDV